MSIFLRYSYVSAACTGGSVAYGAAESSRVPHRPAPPHIFATAVVPTERGATPELLPAIPVRRDALLEGLGDVRLEVTDLSRSVAFYRDGLRFMPEPDSPAEGRDVRLRAGDLRVVLAEASQRRVRPPRNGCGGLSVTVEVSGLDAYYDALVARGLAPSPPRDEGQRRTFTVVDPDGYLWRFSQSLA